VPVNGKNGVDWTAVWWKMRPLVQNEQTAHLLVLSGQWRSQRRQVVEEAPTGSALNAVVRWVLFNLPKQRFAELIRVKRTSLWPTWRLIYAKYILFTQLAFHWIFKRRLLAPQQQHFVAISGPFSPLKLSVQTF
jgi:hypothetical protein